MVDEGSWFYESNGCFQVYKDIENLCGVFPFGLYRFYMIINVLYSLYKYIYIYIMVIIVIVIFPRNLMF